jgi:hypothetical protein
MKGTPRISSDRPDKSFGNPSLPIKRGVGRPRKSQAPRPRDQHSAATRRDPEHPAQTQHCDPKPIPSRRVAGRPKGTHETAREQPTEVVRRKVGRPRKPTNETAREQPTEVVRRKVGRPRKPTHNDTDTMPAKRMVGRPRSTPRRGNNNAVTAYSADRTTRTVTFDFSNGTIARPHRHDTRNLCTKIHKRDREYLASL